MHFLVFLVHLGVLTRVCHEQLTCDCRFAGALGTCRCTSGVLMGALGTNCTLLFLFGGVHFVAVYRLRILTGVLGERDAGGRVVLHGQHAADGVRTLVRGQAAPVDAVVQQPQTVRPADRRTQ